MADIKSSRRCLAIVLAAGEGKRMNSEIPKVLHAIAGRSLLGHVLAGVAVAGADAISIVVGPGRDDVSSVAISCFSDARIFVQTERLGTAHAVLCAGELIEQGFDDIIVAFADTPLVTAATFGKLRDALATGAAVAALGFEARDPEGYGRFILQGGELAAIREHKDATPQERQITICNAGIMALDGTHAMALLQSIGNANAQKEYYLTDAAGAARSAGLSTVAVLAPEAEVMGVNDRVQLAAAGSAMQRKLRDVAMRSGVTMADPDTVFLSFDTKLGRDVTIEPNVFFGLGVEVADGATIKAFSHIDGAKIAANASVGPFARLRPGTKIGEKAKIGNFVEIKASDIGAGAAVSHLTYLGDSIIGAKANIGAGTITCNYDGFGKFRTEIGAGAFIGSNSSLVAPVKIGAGAYVGSGSVITSDVEPDALAVARGRQVVKSGWAASFRAAANNRKRK